MENRPGLVRVVFHRVGKEPVIFADHVRRAITQQAFIDCPDLRAGRLALARIGIERIERARHRDRDLAAFRSIGVHIIEMLEIFRIFQISEE